MARTSGVLRPRDVEARGISGGYLNKLHAEGLLERPSRGIYVLPGTDFGEQGQLAESCKRIPSGVLCLLTALKYHDLTTQAPHEIWMAIDRKSRLPSVEYPPLRFVRYSGRSLTYGVLTRKVARASIRIFSPAKTVADCFKYRHKIGLDVALEALRDCWSKRKATSEQLWEAAKVCRMTNVMRPYMEALL
jgi:predicted transcriptional regulator of viral defense system